ncbi:hypothetical protein L3X38_029752 [Prunus dulcis]|uniref:Uncharacterized protein n=1 Tax=Prunus dulcis TaxID=3755 RepID=A0AAD4Z2R2_PRUDU|nr:hypothetical protein L3X38_029752 [Prunus dulcis]
MLNSPNSFGFLDFSPKAQPSRVGNFPHVEVNYAVHVYIPVYILPAPRKEMAIFQQAISDPLANTMTLSK